MDAKLRLTTDKNLSELTRARMAEALEGEKVVMCMRDRLCLAAFASLPVVKPHLLAAVTTTTEATEAIRDEFATFVICDDVPEAGSGVELVKAHRHLKTVLFSERENSAMVAEASAAGVNALIFKSQIGEDGSGALVAGFAQVARGGVYIPASVHELIEKADSDSLQLISSLTEKERTVLAEVGHGLDNASIAEVLFLSEKTVKSHLKAVRQKAGETDRIQLKKKKRNF